MMCTPGDAMHPPGEIMGYHENMRLDVWFLRREWKRKSVEYEETVLTSIPCAEGDEVTVTLKWHLIRSRLKNEVGRVAQSVQRLATGWTVRASNPGGGEISHTCPDRPWGPSSLLYNGYRVFPGGKERPRRDADPSPPSSSVGHERVELYLYSPYGPYGLYRASVPVQGCTLPYWRMK